MKTVSLETAQKLDDAGWEKETTHHYLQFPDGEWVEWEGVHPGEHLKWLPRPTLDEVLDDLPPGVTLVRLGAGLGYLVQAWTDNPDPSADCNLELAATNVNPADAAADVWIKVKGGKRG